MMWVLLMWSRGQLILLKKTMVDGRHHVVPKEDGR